MFSIKVGHPIFNEPGFVVFLNILQVLMASFVYTRNEVSWNRFIVVERLVFRIYFYERNVFIVLSLMQNTGVI